MATRHVRAAWDGPERDIVMLFLDIALPDYGEDVSDDDDRIILHRQVNGHDEPIGDIVGVEIEDFASFDNWDALPVLPERWQLAGWEPLPLADLLQRLHRTLLAQTPAPAKALR